MGKSRQMKVAIEAQRLKGRQSGVGYVLRGLMQGIRAEETARLGNRKRETGNGKQGTEANQYNFIISGLSGVNKRLLPKNSTVTRLYLPKKIINGLKKYRLLPPLNWLIGRHDVYFFPDFVRWPLTKSQKSVVYVHDLAYLHYPQFIEPKNLKYLRKFVPRSAKKASHIITNSEFSKKDIINSLGVDGKKVSVVNPAVDSGRFKPQPKKEVVRVRKKYGLPENYLLFVGNIEPRKNIEGLIKAYNMLPQPLRVKFPLVLAGAEGWQDINIAAAIKDSPNVKTTGFVDDKDMPGLYSGAALFVLPSHFEGFGIPVLEAMACGTPVACADNSSLPEVAGKAGVLFDSSSVGDIKNKLEELINNPALREKHSKAGLKHAKKFTWPKSAEQLVKILERTAKG